MELADAFGSRMRCVYDFAMGRTLWLVTAMLMVGCTGYKEPFPEYPKTLPGDTPPSTAPVFKTYATWDFYDKLGKLPDRDVENLLRKTVGDIMIAKGYSQPPTGEPDFYVAYHSVAADGEEVGMRVYGYMGPISASHYGTAWGTTWVATPERRKYRQGALIVDIVDGASKRPIMRLHYSARVYSKLEILQRLPRAVYEIFERLPAYSGGEGEGDELRDEEAK